MRRFLTLGFGLVLALPLAANTQDDAQLKQDGKTLQDVKTVTVHYAFYGEVHEASIRHRVETAFKTAGVGYREYQDNEVFNLRDASQIRLLLLVGTEHGKNVGAYLYRVEAIVREEALTSRHPQVKDAVFVESYHDEDLGMATDQLSASVAASVKTTEAAERFCKAWKLNNP